MYCINCGSNLESCVNFCTICGTATVSAAPASFQQQQHTYNAAQPSPTPQNFITVKTRNAMDRRTITIIVISAVLGSVLFILLIVGFIGTVFFGIRSIIYNHPSYQAAIDYIEAHPEIIEIVGDIERFSIASSSTSTSAGFGQAEYVIRVVGSENTVAVQIRLEIEPLTNWEVVSIVYR